MSAKNIKIDYIHHFKIVGVLGCSPRVSDLEEIYEIENSDSFAGLSSSQQFNIYLQYARALQKMQTPERKLTEGRTVADVIIYCFSKAITFQTTRDLRSNKGWVLTSELVSLLINQSNYEDAISAIEEFMKKANFTRENLTKQQCSGLIRLLSDHSLSLSLFTRKNVYREIRYISLMANDPIFRKYWNDYTEILNVWKYLYPSNSKTNTGMLLYTFLSLGNEIKKASETTIDKELL